MLWIFTNFMNFKQEEAIFSLSGMPLKLVDKFKYCGSNISSSENDVNLCLAKAYIAWLSIIWKSDLSNKIKQDFSKLCQYYCMGALRQHWQNAWRKGRWELKKNATCCFQQIQKATPHKTAAIRSPTSHLKNYPSQSQMNLTNGTLLENQKIISNVL